MHQLSLLTDVACSNGRMIREKQLLCMFSASALETTLLLIASV